MIPLSQFARPFVTHPSSRATLGHPVLLMEPQAISTAARKNTRPMPEVDAPMPPPPGPGGEPLIFEVKKAGKSTNTFSRGVTFGRNHNNDICIADDSVSGFHGYFEKDPATGVWSLVDVDSMNGTKAAGVSIVGAHLCGEREVLLIGRVRVDFLSPTQFFKCLDAITR